MNPFGHRSRRLILIGRLAVTLVIACGAVGTTRLVSGSARAIEHIARTDNALAELSHNIADAHGTIRVHVTTPGASADDALRHFNVSVDRRVARLQSLKAAIGQSALAQFGTSPLRGDVDVQRIEADRQAYATAATTALARSDGRAMTLRFLDLHAQKLIQTVEAVRDSVDVARARTLFAAEGVVALSTAIGALLIVYLLWRPVFTRPVPFGIRLKRRAGSFPIPLDTDDARDTSEAAGRPLRAAGQLAPG